MFKALINKYRIINIFILIIVNTLFITGQNTVQDTIQEIIYKPIGVFHTPYTTETGAPRQGILMKETMGSIEIYPRYQSAVNYLGFFEYILVLYHFSEVEEWEPIVNPPASTHEHNFGLFSTRSPKRPNPIGLSLVKLEKIENGILYVSGVDAFEGTPVLDIKPYLPSVDCVKSLQNELIEIELGHHDEKFITDSTFYK
ncbi:MAG: tRNA (N6-threonylcarbamoyladenosine(37)-N6)-methyltransferase TrmO [Bacteroidota bacterium]|nr:tRNA (N6-threonylcarbamoyladenosine(37)-N6)-methyltransferase TrmO [Bacteroidota bacterium]